MLKPFAEPHTQQTPFEMGFQLLSQIFTPTEPKAASTSKSKRQNQSLSVHLMKKTKFFSAFSTIERRR